VLEASLIFYVDTSSQGDQMSLWKNGPNVAQHIFCQN
jgi:hypothetical protein